jgi:BirA family transcriptional regulator, biotin operon repressor / biotin---[acetyl-CoA-carboxylase] ligase
LELPTALVEAGDRLLHFPSVGSTMDEARGLVGALSGGRIWIVADVQTGGRGRQGREWQSPRGNLYLTLLLAAPCEPRHQPKLGFVAGVALCTALRNLVPRPHEVTLKWPNDILLNGAKLSGLLLEGLEQGKALAIGIGVNIVAYPQDTPYPATSLHCDGHAISADMLFPQLANALSDEIKRFGDGSGFIEVRHRWLSMAAHVNKRISVRNGETSWEGLFRDIDADGQLLLETTSGLMRIAAGDVFPLDK